MENRSRRNNLVFFGVSGTETESWNASEMIVKGIIGERLGINDDIPFDRVHRIANAPDVRGSKPIIARFSHYKDREMVMSKAKKLKGSNVIVGEDFSKRLRGIRAKLFSHRSTLVAGNSKLKAFLRYDKLVITDENGKKSRFKVDEET
uniref:Uncharacterized protein LOC102803158 n=1 Tax=Saccoglossus kowalevskii TaxID=10224 RepID=A0ABM0MKS9_SACKO